MKTKCKIINEKGQVLIEFIMTMSFTLALIFLFVKLAINSTVGSMAHYATFVASRRYLVIDNGGDMGSVLNYAKTMATEEFNKVNLKRYGVKNGVLEFLSPLWNPSRDSKMFVGPFYKFELSFSLFSFIGGNKPLTLLSESFLGKEITRKQCFERICEIFKQRLEFLSVEDLCSTSITSQVTVYDDGC